VSDEAGMENLIISCSRAKMITKEYEKPVSSLLDFIQRSNRIDTFD
jgi:hypothetical protein